MREGEHESKEEERQRSMKTLALSTSQTTYGGCCHLNGYSMCRVYQIPNVLLVYVRY